MGAWSGPRARQGRALSRGPHLVRSGSRNDDARGGGGDDGESGREIDGVVDSLLDDRTSYRSAAAPSTGEPPTPPPHGSAHPSAVGTSSCARSTRWPSWLQPGRRRTAPSPNRLS